MRKIELLVKTFTLYLSTFVLLSVYAYALEYGEQHADAVDVSLTNILLDPNKYTKKRVTMWGVIGGYTEATFLFLTHDHARWRDRSNAVQIEPDVHLATLRFGNPAWKNLYGRSVLIEGVLRTEKIGNGPWNTLLVIEHAFIPEDDRQTAQEPQKELEKSQEEDTSNASHELKKQ